MQNQQTIVAGCTGNGKIIKVEGTSLSPECDKIIINKNAPKLSVEYARVRTAINADYQRLFKSNQALAKKLRSQWKRDVVTFLEGKVSTKTDENGQKKMLVTFPDQTVARL